MSGSMIFYVGQLTAATILPFLISMMRKQARWPFVITASGSLLFLGLLIYWTGFFAHKESVTLFEVLGGPGVYELTALSFVLALPFLTGSTLLTVCWGKQ